jgi:hypothetical protein
MLTGGIDIPSPMDYVTGGAGSTQGSTYNLRSIMGVTELRSTLRGPPPFQRPTQLVARHFLSRISIGRKQNLCNVQ